MTEQKRAMFAKYHVKWEFSTWFAAGIPKNPDLLGKFLEVRGSTVEPEEVAGEVAEPSTDQWSVGFKGDEAGIYYEARCVKAHIKDCSNIIKQFVSTKALKSKVADRVQVEPQRIRLWRDGKVIEKADGAYQLPITVMTMQGPRTSIKQVDYIDCPTMEFDLIVLNDGVVDETLLRAIFEYGGTIKGCGQDRGLQYGRYRLAELKELI